MGSNRCLEKEQKNMKILRPSLIAAILCCFAAGAAFATNIHVVFDPTTPGQIGDTYVITDPAAVYSVVWGNCNSPQNGGNPILPPSIVGDDACLAFDNNTGQPLDSFSASFTVTADDGLAGDTLTCNSTDTFLTAATCTNAPLFVGEVVTVQFNDTTGMQIPVNSNFFIAETGAPSLVGTSLTVTAPEPGSITLLAAGMGLVGLCMAFVKR